MKGAQHEFLIMSINDYCLFNNWQDIAIVAKQRAAKAACDVYTYSVILGRAALEYNEEFQINWREHG